MVEIDPVVEIGLDVSKQLSKNTKMWLRAYSINMEKSPFHFLKGILEMLRRNQIQLTNDDVEFLRSIADNEEKRIKFLVAVLSGK